MGFYHSGDEPSVRQQMRSSICFCCCFGGPKSEEEQPAIRVSAIRTSWIRSKELSDLKERCKGLMDRMGRQPGRHCGDFRYDPLSYALNFDQGESDASRLN